VKAADLRGRRFGDLLAVQPIEDGLGRGVVWLCHCRCGAAVERRARQLLQAYRLDLHSACRECVRAWNKHRRSAFSQARHWALLEQWKLTGSLYRFGPDDLPDERVVDTDIVEDRPCANQTTGQPTCFMVPIRAEGETEGGWLCAECRQWLGEGRGCLLCTEPVCATCFEKQSHRCQRFADGQTYEQVGATYGVSRERIRQIEFSALRKMREALARLANEERFLSLQRSMRAA